MATQQQQLQIRYIDTPEVRETFADSVHGMIWDGQTLRVELCVTRFQAPATGSQAEAVRMPACRLVLSATAAAELANRLQQTLTAIKGGGQAGAAAKPVGPDGNPAT
jgi:hypothetical protein